MFPSTAPHPQPSPQVPSSPHQAMPGGKEGQGAADRSSPRPSTQSSDQITPAKDSTPKSGVPKKAARRSGPLPQVSPSKFREYHTFRTDDGDDDGDEIDDFPSHDPEPESSSHIAAMSSNPIVDIIGSSRPPRATPEPKTVSSQLTEPTPYTNRRYSVPSPPPSTLEQHHFQAEIERPSSPLDSHAEANESRDTIGSKPGGGNGPHEGSERPITRLDVQPLEDTSMSVESSDTHALKNQSLEGSRGAKSQEPPLPSQSQSQSQQQSQSKPSHEEDVSGIVPETQKSSSLPVSMVC